MPFVVTHFCHDWVGKVSDRGLIDAFSFVRMQTCAHAQFETEKRGILSLEDTRTEHLRPLPSIIPHLNHTRLSISKFHGCFFPARRKLEYETETFWLRES